MGKGKKICCWLVPILAVSMTLSPFPVMETAEASSVSNAWVELSDGTALNKTGTALEYVIHLTTTTALSGGVDTITVTFPSGTTEMAGEEGSGYAFDLPDSIDKDDVAVDSDGALTTITGYTDCYTAPDVGSYRVRLTVPEDIAAGASPYVKFETTANIQSASQDKTTAGALCYYRVKVETSKDTTPVYSEYFYLGDTDSVVSSVDHLSGYPNPATVGAAAEYKFEFTVGASGALTAGSGTITVIFPSGTTVPASASKNYVQVDADGSGDSEGNDNYSLTACAVDPTCHPASRMVTLTVPQSVTIDEEDDYTNVYIYFTSGFGLVNPTTSASAAKVKIFTSAEPKYATAATGYAITADTATKVGFANVSGAYSDDATMVNMYSSTIYLQLQDQYGNIKAPGSDQTASLNSTSSTGKFYSAAGSQISSATIYDGTGDPSDTTAGQFSFLYKDTASGTHTITATAGGYTSATWTITVAPAVSLYDTSNELVNTYAPTSTSPVAESGSVNSGDYLQNAIYDALPGETVKLGDGTYELDTGLTMAKAITLESVNGAASTALRPATKNLYGVWGTSSSNVYAVGASGTILKYVSSWTSKTSGTSNNLYGVGGKSDGSHVHAVGASGTALYSTDGNTWTVKTSGTTNNLYAVWENSDTSYAYVVGASGTILEYSGSWSAMDNDDTHNLYGVWGYYSDPTTYAYAVGASGTILYYNGTTWGSKTSGTTNTLYSVWGSSATNVFAVGASGIILHSTSGTDWSELNSGTADTLYGVWGNSGSDVFAVGACGTVVHYDGTSWSSMSSGTTDDLRGVWGNSGSDVFAVGACGTVVHYDGTSWSSMESPTNTIDKAINITATGSATYGVTIDGITFTRLRSGKVFNYGIYDQSADYITVRNCIFNYIYNRGVMLTSTSAAFTEGTIGNNTFTNGGGYSVASTDAAIDVTATTSKAISGITISGNTITGQKGKGIYLDGGDSTHKVSSISITGNTITKATSYGIQGCDEYTDTIAITSNTITGCYGDGIDVYGTAYTIKKNVVTGNLGDGIDVEYTSASHLINYNDIYNNTGYGVNVRSSVTTVNTRYNWWGDASGPTYTAATGASVTVSNPEGTGENITDRVTYYEWLYQPIADVIADNVAYYSRVVSLNVGWNTLSTPIILDDSTDTVGEVVDPAKMTIAYWYDTNDADTDGTYWEQVTSDYELSPCDAIYIKMNAADSVLLKYNAADISLPTKDLYAGWNLIGLASLETKHVDDAVQSVANTPTNLPGYSQVISPSMNSEDWTFSYGQSYTDEDMLVGEGYWVYMQNDCTLVGFTITPIEPSLD
jgi:hypothetical protein